MSDTIQAPIPDFHALGLSTDLLDGLDHMNIRKPTPIQQQAIRPCSIWRAFFAYHDALMVPETWTVKAA